MDDESFDDLVDRLPNSLKHKILEHLYPEDAPPPTERIPLTRHFGLKFVASSLLGIFGLLLGLALAIASVGMLTPVSIILALLCTAPLAHLAIHVAEVIRSRNNA